MASREGFEPPTDGLEGRCSIQLSYETIVRKRCKSTKIKAICKRNRQFYSAPAAAESRIGKTQATDRKRSAHRYREEPPRKEPAAQKTESRRFSGTPLHNCGLFARTAKSNASRISDASNFLL